MTEGRLRRMRDLLSHRGPDDAGIWIDGAVGLGHRRLSIIDLEAGKQPLSNETGTVWLTFNGEIYNYKSLRRVLIDRGHRFRTHTDTEVLAHGYEEWGDDLPSHLNGIFAFGIYDVQRRRLLLARDHLGVKPLFYGIRNGELAFASEPRSVLDALSLSPEPWPAALAEYLTFRYMAGDRSFFEGVSRLPGGHAAVWQDGRFEIKRYWSPMDTVPTGNSVPHAVDELDHHLSTAVSRQLMSDVPLGAFCSGGIDSGLATYYAVKAGGEAEFRTFSVALEDSAWDETPLALETARALGTKHSTVLSRAASVRQGLEALLQYGDEPLSHPNMVPLLDLSRFARQGVTVVLTGEGADELFCGYPRYHIVRAIRYGQWLPRWVRKGMSATLGGLPGHRSSKLGRALEWSLDEAILYNSAFVDPAMVRRLVGKASDGAVEDRRALIRQTTVPNDPVASLSRYELTTYLVSALERLDRVSMAVGLEARVPFLDIDMVEWGLGLPSDLKLHGSKNKYVVKRLAQGKLGPRVLGAPKSGFGLPLDSWFRTPDFEDLMTRMAAPDHPAAAFLDPKVVRAIIDDHREERGHHGEVLWLLANLYLWFDVHTGAEKPESVGVTGSA